MHAAAGTHTACPTAEPEAGLAGHLLLFSVTVPSHSTAETLFQNLLSPGGLNWSPLVALPEQARPHLSPASLCFLGPKCPLESHFQRSLLSRLCARKPHSSPLP